MSLPNGFFAYASNRPNGVDSMRLAIEKINEANVIKMVSWEDNNVTGHVVIDEICSQIDKCDVFCADLTDVNPNVLFEVGYAIARGKRTWFSFDTSMDELLQEFNQMGVLPDLGYSKFTNSFDLSSAFLNEQPFLDLERTLFADNILPNLTSATKSGVFYLKSNIETDASIKISNTLESSSIPLILNDPQEATVQTLTWYGVQAYSCQGLVCHFTSPQRQGARVINARYSFVAGLAYGFSKPVLMLAEENYQSPFDYRTLLRRYRGSSEASNHVKHWLGPIQQSWQDAREDREAYARSLKLVTELKGLRIGEPFAENESEQLVEEFFVETVSFEEGMKGTQTIFVGRKGSGKSANLLKIDEMLKRDVRNIVCVIKPLAYELQAVIKLLDRYTESNEKGYAIESLWKFLLYSEIAKTTYEQLIVRPSTSLSEDENELINLVDEDNLMLKQDFAIRLERCIDAILSAESRKQNSIEHVRIAISEAIHDKNLNKIRLVLGKVLSGKNRIAILIDNLDKAWDKNSDLSKLSQFLLGLFSVSDRIIIDLKSASARVKPLNATLAIFIRSDIFYQVIKEAREQDKIVHTRITWDDPEALMRVIDYRLLASDQSESPETMWRKYFCPEVKGIPTKEYLLQCVLPRPRDLIYMIKVAISNAVNRGHAVVTEGDIATAEIEYSKFALDSIRTENVGRIPNFDDVILEFSTCKSTLAKSEVEQVIASQVDESLVASVIDYLCDLSFLGLEIADGKFSFVEEVDEIKRNRVLAQKLADRRRSEIMYKINRPFWAYLEIAG